MTFNHVVEGSIPSWHIIKLRHFALKMKKEGLMWLDKIAGLNGLATDALHRKTELIEQLSKVDRELSDIAHYIEFNNLNAAQGYKAYKMEHERRIIRRSIKNEIQVLEIILGKKISETVTDEINNAVAGMDQRSYEPRELNELFDF